MKWADREIRDLTTGHLVNAIRWIERKWWESSRAEPAEVARAYPDLIEEATCRGLVRVDYEPQRNRPIKISETGAKS